MAYNEDSSASGHDEPWIQWFCGLKGHEMFCEVERSYIEDGFNLYGLRACVSNFSDCLDLILDRIGPDDSDDSHLTQSACTLYGLIHARYIITAHGLDAMYNKYAAKEFGTCPLIQCNGQPVLPTGLKDEMGADTVKIFCPKCQCVYHPPPIRSRSSHHGPGNASGSGAVDGAAFGTTFPHLFLMTFNNLVPDPLDQASQYVPRVFGFRVHQSARQKNVGGGSGSAAAAFSSSTLPQGNSGRRAAALAAAAAGPALPRGGADRGGGGGGPTSSAMATGVTSTGGGAAGGPSSAGHTRNNNNGPQGQRQGQGGGGAAKGSMPSTGAAGGGGNKSSTQPFQQVIAGGDPSKASSKAGNAAKDRKDGDSRNRSSNQVAGGGNSAEQRHDGLNDRGKRKVKGTSSVDSGKSGSLGDDGGPPNRVKKQRKTSGGVV